MFHLSNNQQFHKMPVAARCDRLTAASPSNASMSSRTLQVYLLVFSTFCYFICCMCSPKYTIVIRNSLLIWGYPLSSRTGPACAHCHFASCHSRQEQHFEASSLHQPAQVKRYWNNVYNCMTTRLVWMTVCMLQVGVVISLKIKKLL